MMLKLMLLTAAAAGIAATAATAKASEQKKARAVLPVKNHAPQTAVVVTDRVNEPTAQEYDMDYMFV